ncbi:MAG: hypothetical protein AB8C46_24460 [Burkholderiaceae bacterium]
MKSLSSFTRPVLRAAICSAAITLASPTAIAAEVYGGIGLPGAFAGFSKPIGERFAFRGDVAALPGMDGTRTEDGIRYDAQSEVRRLGLFGDWFAFGGGFRLTGGLTFNQFKIDLQARPEGNTIMIGDRQFPVSDGDRFDAQVKFPSVTPYLGIGYGHHAAERGWGFHADLGVSIGRATVTAQASGNLANQPGIADEIAREQAELEEGVGKIRAIPQLSIGISYRF